MKKNTLPPETLLLNPVLRLFPKKKYRRYTEVALGNRRVDLVCMPKTKEDDSVSIELKVKDWKKAVWQAVINYQVSKRVYIAIWHEYAHLLHNAENLLEKYSIGIIEVKEKSAAITFEPNSWRSVKSITREYDIGKRKYAVEV